MTGRASEQQDRPLINQLLRETLGIGETAAALHPAYQNWKYWDTHPWFESPRSRLWIAHDRPAAHVCLWPVRLETLDGQGTAFHPIDWGAKRDVPGAGLNVLQSSYVGCDAAFSIGGSDMTRKILPAFGYKPHNRVTLLYRPLHAWNPAWQTSPRDWKLPARVGRNWWQSRSIPSNLPETWTVRACSPAEIDDALWPRPKSAEEAVSHRSPALIEHVRTCPLLGKSAVYVLLKKGLQRAYFLLVQARDQVRAADYGPTHLDGETARVLGDAIQRQAKIDFPKATSLMAMTPEDEVAQQWQDAGLLLHRHEEVRALKRNKALTSVKHFHLTMMDSDAVCI